MAPSAKEEAGAGVKGTELGEISLRWGVGRRGVELSIALKKGV